VMGRAQQALEPTELATSNAGDRRGDM